MVDKLIDLYEVRPCLWDIADPTYSKRNVKEKALSEIKEQLGMEITAIKAKWNSLRAQHRWELAKENKTKSGQSADDLYESSWQYMEKMRFVEQVKKTAQSTSTLKLSESSLSAEVSDTEIDLQDDSFNSSEPLVEKSSKRKRPNINKQKSKLIAKCTDVLDRPKAQTLPTKETPDPFALYISEQLKSLEKRRRLLAEKRINDVLFELRFEEFGATSAYSTTNNLQLNLFKQCQIFDSSLQLLLNSPNLILLCYKIFKPFLLLYCIFFIFLLKPYVVLNIKIYTIK